jgi:hypothetical protein
VTPAGGCFNETLLLSININQPRRHRDVLELTFS